MFKAVENPIFIHSHWHFRGIVSIPDQAYAAQKNTAQYAPLCLQIIRGNLGMHNRNGTIVSRGNFCRAEHILKKEASVHWLPGPSCSKAD